MYMYVYIHLMLLSVLNVSSYIIHVHWIESEDSVKAVRKVLDFTKAGLQTYLGTIIIDSELHPPPCICYITVMMTPLL